MARKIRKRFKNVTKKLQVVYDEAGNKKEVVPGGTVIMDADWGFRYRKVLAKVESKPAKAE